MSNEIILENFSIILWITLILFMIIIGHYYIIIINDKMYELRKLLYEIINKTKTINRENNSKSGNLIITSFSSLLYILLLKILQCELIVTIQNLDKLIKLLKLVKVLSI